MIKSLFTDLSSWTSLVQQAAPKNDTQPHSYLCAVRHLNNPMEIKSLTPEEYRDFYKSHSRWNSTCSKLSLNEIFSISQFLLGIKDLNFRGYELRNTHIAKKDISIEASLLDGECIMINRPIDSKISEFVHFFSVQEADKDLQTEIETLIQPYLALSSSLKKMIYRSTSKHEKSLPTLEFLHKIKKVIQNIKCYKWKSFSIKNLSLKVPLDKIKERAQKIIGYKWRNLCNREGILTKILNKTKKITFVVNSCLWKIFYDKTSNLKLLEIYSKQNLKKILTDPLQERLWVNILDFYDLALHHLPETSPHHYNQLQKEIEELETKKEINPQFLKKWFVKFSDDKFKLDHLCNKEKQEAQDYRIRILALYQTYLQIEKFFETHSFSERDLEEKSSFHKDSKLKLLKLS